jgi:hypothetical protein
VCVCVCVCVPYSQWLYPPFFLYLTQGKKPVFILRVCLVRFQVWTWKPSILNYACFFKIVPLVCLAYFSQLLLHVPIVLKSGSLNLLEPSGPVKACNGILLLLLLFIHSSCGTAAHSQALASHFVGFRNNWVLRCGVICNTEGRKVA